MANRFAGGLPSTGGIRVTRKAASLPQAPVLMLEKLPSQNLELSQVIHRDTSTVEQGYTKVMLRGVPRFLIDAFARILEEGKTVEGLFRKEGNQARMKNSQDVYYCKESVRDARSTWTIHDVCSLVKRFLRDLKTPLITNDIKMRLFEYAKAHPDGVIEPHRLTILFEPTFSDKGIIHPMPAEHIGTLGFIMRQLNELSQDASVHQMTLQNLATVFAPTIFRDATCSMGPGGGAEVPKTPKMMGGKGALVLQKSMEENDLRIAATVVLIKNSQWIGVPSNFYLASRKDSTAAAPAAGTSTSATYAAAAAAGASSSSAWTRSNSLRPSHSMYSAAGLAALPTAAAAAAAGGFSKAEKGGSVSGRKIEKRHSVKMAIASRGRGEEKEGKDRRRSSSTVRDIFSRLSSVGDRVRRKSGERKSPSRRPSPTPSQSTAATAAGAAGGGGGWKGKGGGTGSSRGRSPAKKMMLEVHDHEVSTLTAVEMERGEEDGVRSAVATSRPSLQSSSFLQSLPSKSPKLVARAPSVQQQQQLAAAAAAVVAAQKLQQAARPARPALNSTSGASTTSISSAGSCNVQDWKKGSSPLEGRKRVSGGGSAAAAAGATTQPLPRRSVTSVRDEPASMIGEDFLNPGHKYPINRVRRHTAPIKTGLALRRNQPNTVHSGLKGPIRRATMAAADEKENARSLIRVIARRREREEDMEEEEYYDEDATLTDSNRTMSGSINVHVVYPSTAESVLEMTHLESRARRANFRRRKSGGGGGSTNGSRVLVESPVKGEGATSATSPASGSGATTAKSPAPPPLPLCSPPMGSAERVNSSGGSGRRSGKRAAAAAGAAEGGEERVEAGKEGGEDVEMEMLPPAPLSAPPIPRARRSVGGEKEGEEGEAVFAIPKLPVARTMSVSHASGPSSSHSSSQRTPVMGRRAIGSTPLSSKTPVATHSPLGRRGSSASALDSPQFKPPSSLASRRQMSAGEKEFAFSERNRAAILEAHDSTELPVHAKVGTRPSVALLRNSNRGMVAARVNLFAAIQSTNDAENASMRSSIGSSRQSLTGLDETLVSGRGGPPVGHSIMSSGGSSSGNSSKRSSIASHR